ncbi:MAG: histidine phosphotransferase family protein [Hyphomicrobium sp.]
MNDRPQLSDLEVAALISSKICHDVIGPVGAINIGLQLFEEEKEEDARQHAFDMIRNVSHQASICLEFARFAFGASGSAGSLIDLGMAETLSRNYVVHGKGKGKHKLLWKSPPGSMQKDKLKLLLNLIASAITALPRGGEIEVSILGSLELPTFLLICRGTAARLPQYLGEFLTETETPQIDAMTIQAYYTTRLSHAAKMHLAIGKEGQDIVLVAKPI